MKTIVFATGNPNKLKEINEISKGFEVEFILPANGFNPIENGSSFEENSLIKAKEAYRISGGKMVLADDSGLCVDALNGAPGIYSNRYAGTQDEKIEKILKELIGVENRNAKFVCCMTLLDINGNILMVKRGECFGSIVEKRSDIHGFGYDPIFLVNGTNLTMDQMDEQEKNIISHRGIALRE